MACLYFFSQKFIFQPRKAKYWFGYSWFWFYELRFSRLNIIFHYIDQLFCLIGCDIGYNIFVFHWFGFHGFLISNVIPILSVWIGHSSFTVRRIMFPWCSQFKCVKKYVYSWLVLFNIFPFCSLKFYLV